MNTDAKAVARFNFDNYHGCEFEADDGYWVLFTDHERVVGKLRTELDALNEAQAVGDGTISGSLLHWHQRALAAETSLAESRAEVEGLKKDVERYRWLRDKAPEEWDVTRWLGNEHQEVHVQDYLDEAIDAEMENGNV